MEFNNKIDVIIPVYKVSDEMLNKCLSSIACQSIIKDITVTVVDDATPDRTYDDIINNFKSIMDIQLFRMETNGGPGVARQYALDRTFNEYVAFADADDTLDNTYSLQKLRYALTMDGNHFQMAVGFFKEAIIVQRDHPDEMAFLDHEEDMVWLFGKLYRRAIIEKFNIRFHPTSRANEDAGFNAQMQLCLDRAEVNFIEEFLYCWHDNPDSITRFNNYKYAHDSSKNASFYGYVENMIYTVKHAREVNPNNIDYINFYGCRVMQFLYTYYLECCQYGPEDAPKNLEWCKLYYNEIFKDTYEAINKEHFMQGYVDAMIHLYEGHINTPFIPHITFWQFIDLCKEDYMNYEEEK